MAITSRPGADLLRAFDDEMAVTRRVLSLIPPRDLSWRAHPRAMTLATLAAHIADIPRWAPGILRSEGYDAGASAPPSASTGDVPALLAMFDANVASTREQLGDATAAVLSATWTLRSGLDVLAAFTRAQSLHVFVVSHVVHHRGQLSVYLRMRNVDVPPFYDPAAAVRRDGM